MLLGELVALRRLLRPLVALGQVRVEVRFGTAAPESLDPRLPLQLPVQQVDLLEGAAALAVLQDQLRQPRLPRAGDSIDVIGSVPFVPALPAVEGLFLLA